MLYLYEKCVDLSMANCNSHNQMVLLKTSGHPFLVEGNLRSRANKQSDKALGTHDDLIDSARPKKKNCTMSNYMISSSFTIIYSLAILGLTYTSPTNRMPIFMNSSLNSFAVSVIHSVPCKPVPRLQWTHFLSKHCEATHRSLGATETRVCSCRVAWWCMN
jgi:hypothetical protein